MENMEDREIYSKLEENQFSISFHDFTKLHIMENSISIVKLWTILLSFQKGSKKTMRRFPKYFAYSTLV